MVDSSNSDETPSAVHWTPQSTDAAFEAIVSTSGASPAPAHEETWGDLIWELMGFARRPTPPTT